MIWAASLAMSCGVKRGEHLSIRFLVDALPPVFAYVIDTFFRILLSGFFLILIIYGIKLVQTNSEFISQALNLNMASPTSSVPIAGILMLIQLIISIFLRLTSGGDLKGRP